jgi:hypothetical protein
LDVVVPEGGQVISESGKNDCFENQTCPIDVSDAEFDEQFTAVPNDDYYFTGWKDSSGKLCGGRGTKPCRLTTKLFAGNDALMSLLDSDNVYYIEPAFIKKQPGADVVREIEDVQQIQFVGTSYSAVDDEERLTVPMRFTQLYKRTGNVISGIELIEYSLTGKGIGSPETFSSTQILWQEETGSIYAVVLDNGFAVYDTSAEVPWILVTPSPLVPNTRLEIPFFVVDALADVIVGDAETVIEVSDKENVTVPMGGFSAFKVTASQEIDVQVEDESAVAFTDAVSWIVPEIGLVKQSFETTVYFDDVAGTVVHFGGEMEAVSAN